MGATQPEITATPAPRAKRLKRPRSRHGLTAPLVKVRLRGFSAIDQRYAGAREGLAFRDELIAFSGGQDEIVPTTMKQIELAVRASMLLDSVDRWLFQQSTLVNGRTKAILPVLVQRQAIAEHLAKILDRLGYSRKPKRVQTIDQVLQEIAEEKEHERQDDQRPENQTAPDGAES